jgi:hypothetical protein
MNKYQEQLLAGTTISLTSCDDKSQEKVIMDAEKISIYQNIDYHKTDYLFAINNSSLESLEILGKLYKASEGKIEVKISFEKPFASLIVHFKNGVVNPCSFTVDFLKADKKAYDDKVISDERNALINGMDISIGVGQNLLNIYWKNTNNSVAYTSVKLYYKNTLFMEEFKIDSGKFYLAIPNLAYGTYSFVLGQFTKDGKPLIETDLTKIELADSKNGLTDKLIVKLNDIEESVEKVAAHTRPHIIHR